MEFAIIDSITQLGPEYISFFPARVKKGGKNCYGHIKAKTYRWEIALYVDSPEKYASIGGKQELEKTIPLPKDVLSPHNWENLSGVPIYEMPSLAKTFFRKDFKVNVIVSREIVGDRLTVRTLPLLRVDSADGLSKVSSVCFDFTSARVQYMTESESQKLFHGIKNLLEQFILKNKTKKAVTFDELLFSVLKPLEVDNGLIRGAKMRDFCQAVDLWDGLVHPSPNQSVEYNRFVYFDGSNSNWSRAIKMYPNEAPSGTYYGFINNLKERYHKYYFSKLLDNARRISNPTNKEFARRIIMLLKAQWIGTGVSAPQDLYEDFSEICSSIEKG